MDLAHPEQRKDDGKAPAEARREDSAKRLAIAESEFLQTEFEHGRETGLEMKASLLDFGEVRHQFRRDLAMRANELCGIREELAIGKMPDFHAVCLACGISCSATPRRRAFARRDTSRGA